MPKDIWHSMEAHLRGIDAHVGRRPKAVLVVTAHWMTPRPTLGNAAEHHLLYDYYNFPDYTYQLKYPVKGSPEVAARAAALLTDAGIASDMNDTRGIDHGVFIPFKLIYPDADVPIVPMSLRQDLDPAAHIAIGEAIAPLRDEDVLIVGSGMSFHNVRAIMTGTMGAESVAFDNWLVGAAAAPPDVRTAALTQWSMAPGGRQSHPEEEHLLPLMVAAGAAGPDTGTRGYAQIMGGKALSGFMFGSRGGKNQ